MIVVSDTSPLCYLVLIGEVELLPRFFGQIVVPPSVQAELESVGAPSKVRAWIGTPPAWLEVRALTQKPAAPRRDLQVGERDVLSLAVDLAADLVLLDDKPARQEAAELGLRMTGLLGVLDRAARAREIDLPEAIRHLRQTNFRIAPALLQALLQRHLPK